MKKAIFLLLVLSTLLLAQSDKWQAQIDVINKAMVQSVMNKTPEASIKFYNEKIV